MKKVTTTCPWCGVEVAVRRDGALNKHGFRNNTQGQAEHRSTPCEGSGKNPNLANEDLSRPVLRLRTSTV